MAVSVAIGLPQKNHVLVELWSSLLKKVSQCGFVLKTIFRQEAFFLCLQKYCLSDFLNGMYLWGFGEACRSMAADVAFCCLEKSRGKIIASGQVLCIKHNHWDVLVSKFWYPVISNEVAKQVEVWRSIFQCLRFRVCC